MLDDVGEKASVGGARTAARTAAEQQILMVGLFYGWLLMKIWLNVAKTSMAFHALLAICRSGFLYLKARFAFESQQSSSATIVSSKQLRNCALLLSLSL